MTVTGYMSVFFFSSDKDFNKMGMYFHIHKGHYGMW